MYAYAHWHPHSKQVATVGGMYVRTYDMCDLEILNCPSPGQLRVDFAGYGRQVLEVGIVA